MSGDAYVVTGNGEENTIISGNASAVPDGKDRMLAMIAEQDRRDEIRRKLFRRIQRNRDIEAGIVCGFGFNFDGEDE